MKKILTIIIVLLVGLFGWGYMRSVGSPAPSARIVVEKIPVEVKIEGEESISGQVIKDSTALDYLKANYEVVTNGEGVNAYVVEINGRRADDKKKEFWSFYINGKMAEVGAGSYILRSNDKIEWKIENY